MTKVGSPTAVTLTSFNSSGVTGNQVSILWTLASEVDLYGFNIYRSNNNDLNTAVLVNDKIISADGSSKYTIPDTVPLDGNYWYWITFVSMSAAESPVQGTFQVTVTSPNTFKLFMPLVKR